VHDLALGDLRRHAGLHRPLEDRAEALGAPALTNASQGRMIRQRLVQSIAGEALGDAGEPQLITERGDTIALQAGDRAHAIALPMAS
jgi:hypothetical protein